MPDESPSTLDTLATAIHHMPDAEFTDALRQLATDRLGLIPRAVLAIYLEEARSRLESRAPHLSAAPPAEPDGESWDPRWGRESPRDWGRASAVRPAEPASDLLSRAAKGVQEREAMRRAYAEGHGVSAAELVRRSEEGLNRPDPPANLLARVEQVAGDGFGPAVVLDADIAAFDEEIARWQDDDRGTGRRTLASPRRALCIGGEA
jgi:hypothetical protein